MTSVKLGYERVFTVTDYYDGPREGVADYRGQPCFYRCIFDHNAGDWSNLFELRPMSNDVFQLAMEHWQIWCRWETAFHAGTVGLDSHPALPEERARYDELERMLNNARSASDGDVILRQGHFDVVGDEPLPKGVLRPMQVKWTDAPGRALVDK